MESWQKEHIRKNLVELIKNTTCGTDLIAGLISKNVLSQGDAEEIELPNLTPSDKCKKLYQKLQTRVGSYDILVQTLAETRQSGARTILIDHNAVFRCYGNITYDKNHILGTGCSGTKVFKGIFDGRDVAVKVMNTDFISTEDAKREVNFLKKLDIHPNIVRYFFAESRKNYIYIALEYCDVSLQDEVNLNLMNMEPINILEQCTRGLLHLHKHNIIHRDIKPANILLKYENQVKLSDFGISKQIPEGMTSVSYHSGVGGTRDWMAPEILKLLIKKNEPIRMKKSADVFSLGCTFFFVLTNGSHPFGNIYERQNNIYLNQPQLKSLNFEPKLMDFIQAMISHQPSQRPRCEDILASDCLNTSVPKYQDHFNTSAPENIEPLQSTNLEVKIDSLNDPNVHKEHVAECSSILTSPIFEQNRAEEEKCLAPCLQEDIMSVHLEGGTWQRQYVNKSLPYLIHNMNCDVILLDRLRTLRVLTDTDVSTLKAKDKIGGEHVKTRCLIDILITRKLGYECLTKALFECRQTGALLKMLEGFKINLPGANPFQQCEIELNVDEILAKGVTFGGNKLTLKDVCKDIKPNLLQDLITSAMDATSFEHFLSAKPTELTVDTIPSNIPYYIPRTLFINTQLDPKIFDTVEGDIFCIEGIQLYQLSALSNRKGNCISDRSRNQTHDVTARFILLENRDHFQDIADQTQKSVHWIQYKNNNFFYVRCSTGDGIQAIQKCIIPTNSQQLTEDEFLLRCQNGPRNATILLYDSPGMGKSILLARLARKTKESHPNCSVIFLQISELISKVQQVQQEPSSAVIIQALVESITTNRLGQNITKALMDSINHQIELFLDAFDEVPEGDLDRAHFILSSIAKECKNIRMYVTTRRHKRDELEEKFGMLGYNILPFDDSNKLLFFLNYWQSEYDVEINDQIKEYAQQCLKTVSTGKSCDESDIAGIPLQCKMLADIYAKDAQRGAPLPTEPQLKLKSIFHLYQHYIDTKFSTICTETERQISYDFHVRESIRTLFPEHLKHFQEDLFVPVGEMIYRIGILEPLQSDSNAFGFSHRTLAEYFAAEFLTTAPTSKLSIHSDFINLFFHQALMWSVLERNVYERNKRKDTNFQNPVVCRFLNFFLSPQHSKVRDFGPVKRSLRESKYYNSRTLVVMLECCLRIDAVYLYLLLLDIYLDLDESGRQSTSLLKFKQNLQDSQNWEVKEVGKVKLVNGLKESKRIKRLVPIAAEHSSLNLVQLSCDFLESVTGKKVHQIKYNKEESPMYFALQRGHYQIFEFLLNLDEEECFGMPLLHWCVDKSYESNVEDKVQIVKRILDERPDLLNKLHPEYKCVPLLSWGVHFSLVKCLIEAGADLTKTNEHNQNIAHTTAECFSADQYHEFVEFLISRNAEVLFQRNWQGPTPVLWALLTIDLKSETLELLAKKCNVTFNNYDNYLWGTELATAIERGRSERVVKDILRLGGDRYQIKESLRQKLAKNYNM